MLLPAKGYFVCSHYTGPIKIAPSFSNSTLYHTLAGFFVENPSKERTPTSQSRQTLLVLRAVVLGEYRTNYFIISRAPHESHPHMKIEEDQDQAEKGALICAHCRPGQDSIVKFVPQLWLPLSNCLSEKFRRNFQLNICECEYFTWSPLQGEEMQQLRSSTSMFWIVYKAPHNPNWLRNSGAHSKT